MSSSTAGSLPASDRALVVRGTAAIIAAACCFGSIPPLTVIATRHGMALEAVQTWRHLAAAFLLVVFALRRAPNHTEEKQNTSHLSPWYSPRVFLVAGAGQASVAALSLAALAWLPAATASFLFYTYPAWVAVLAAIRGTEHLDRHRIVALVLSLVGLALMVGMPSAGSLAPAGVTLILLSAIVYAFFIPFLGKLQQGRNPMDVARAVAVGGATYFVVWSVASGALFVPPASLALVAALTQGVLSAFAFTGLLTGIRLLGPVRTAITSTVEPFWTAMLGVTLLAQPLGIATLAGGALIMAAVLLLQLPAAYSARRALSAAQHKSNESDNRDSGK